MTGLGHALGRAGGALDDGSITETPVFYEADGETLFALHSRPTGASRGVGVVLLGGGWFGTSAGRNRTLVRLARALAVEGFHVVRPDWHGMGESTGEIDRYNLDEPFVADLVGAVDVLREADVAQVVTVGICFGARTSLSAISTLAGLAGLVLASAPVQRAEQGVGQFRVSGLANRLTLRDYVRRGARLQVLRALADPGVRRGYRKAWLATWRARSPRMQEAAAPTADPSVVTCLADAARRSLPMLFIYGEDDGEYAGFKAVQDEIAPHFSRQGGRVQLRSLPGTLPGFPRLETQTQFIAAVVAWMDEQFPERSLA